MDWNIASEFFFFENDTSSEQARVLGKVVGVRHKEK
jgi:hypothetical protein